jgi:ribosomal protein S18 acetylase RimI-like enzyme
MTIARVRRATRSDLKEVAALAAELVTQHHTVDPERFFLPERVEEGYALWLGRELERSQAVVLVAEVDGRVAGYAYGTLEGRNWNALLAEHGAIHDILVASSVRGRGVGGELLGALLVELEAAGAPRIVLQTMVSNQPAQRLFAKAGFRPTMLEMTRNRG